MNNRYSFGSEMDYTYFSMQNYYYNNPYATNYYDNEIRRENYWPSNSPNVSPSKKKTDTKKKKLRNSSYISRKDKILKQNKSPEMNDSFDSNSTQSEQKVKLTREVGVQTDERSMSAFRKLDSCDIIIRTNSTASSISSLENSKGKKKKEIESKSNSINNDSTDKQKFTEKLTASSELKILDNTIVKQETKLVDEKSVSPEVSLPSIGKKRNNQPDTYDKIHVKKVIKYLGVKREDPNDYLRKHQSRLSKIENLNEFIKEYPKISGITEIMQVI
jgi:hypothetical protein